MNRKTAVYFTLFITLGISFICCSRPKEVLSKKSMESLLYDIYIAEAMIDNDFQNFDTPQKKEALISQVFKKHNVTQSQWDSSLAWYSDRADVYLRINDSVKSRLKREQEALQLQISKESSQHIISASRFISDDYIPQIYSFNEVSSQNGFRFRLDSDYITENIEQNNIDFSFDAIGIPQHIQPNLVAALILQYKDTTIYKTKAILHNQKYIINGQKYIKYNRDTLIINDTIREVIGFVKLQDCLRQFNNIQLYNIFIGKKNNEKEKQSIDNNLAKDKQEILEKSMQKQ